MSFHTRLTRTLVMLEGKQTDELLRVLKSSQVRYGDRTLGQFDDDELMSILKEIMSVVPPQQQKFTRYYVYQVAAGHLPLRRIKEDAVRFSQTIDDFKVLSKKREWTGSRNIFDFDDWRKLETALLKLKNAAQPAADDTQHAIVLYTDKFGAIGHKNAVLVAELMGLPPPEQKWVQFWLRKILTPEGSSKYGKGTQWCTNTDLSNYPDPRQHPFHAYAPLYILEKAANNRPRGPLMQFSRNDCNGRFDVPVSKISGNLRQFLTEAIPVCLKADPDFQQVLPHIQELL